MSSRTGSLYDHLGYWLRILSNAVSSSFARRLEAHGVSVPQWAVLRLLYDRKNCSLAELSGALDMDKGALSRMIDRLLKLGLVRREESAKSRRQVALSLTRKAESLIPKLVRAADENDRNFFGVLTERQRTEFSKTIQLLISSQIGTEPKHPLH